MKHRAELAVLLLMMAADGRGQPPADHQPPLAFEVASIKVSHPQPGAPAGIRPQPGGQTYSARSVPVKLIIKLMYHLMDSQLVGGPDWLDTDRYDIEAKAARASTTDQLHEMFRTLLAERFQLKMHVEKKALPVYALLVDKAGRKFKVSESADAFEIPIKPLGLGKIAGTRVSMPHFSWYLSQQLDRPVLDQTGLTGFYDFTFSSPPRLVGPASDARPESVAGAEGPDIFSALREQLGLKLESRRGLVDVYVIDRVERPSEN